MDKKKKKVEKETKMEPKMKSTVHATNIHASTIRAPPHPLRMMEIKRIEPFSVGRIVGLIYAICGFLWALMLILTSWSGYASMFTGSTGSMFLPGSLGGLLIIIAPLLYGLWGFVSGVILSWLYNWLARNIRGIKIEV